MFKRIASSGLNLAVLGVSILVFIAAFIALTAIGAAQKPPTIAILSASRDLSIGDVIASDMIVEETVFEDGNAALYIPSSEAPDVVGGIVAQPIFAGQPILRSAIVAKAAEETRLSAALAQYPGYSLFPLPLDAMNLVAPEAASFLPGDLVGITVVISSRPQDYSTPAPESEMIIEAPAIPVTPSSIESALSDALGRIHPPLAKDLFPQGVRVIAVQGLPAATTDADGGTSTFNDFSQSRILMLLVPNESREVLALALQQGDKLVVSLMARGEEQPTAGFTYWDFEDLLQSDREDVITGRR